MGNPAGGAAVTEGNRELTDYERDILANVEEYGCHVTTVLDPEGDDPSFSYSTGFSETLDQGEVIIFGLDHKLMHRMINITMELCRDGLILSEGERIAGVLEGFDIVAREIPASAIDREHFNSAMWFHRRRYASELRSAFQIVWPGARQGLFPWEDGCDEYVVRIQPPLYERGVVH
jgi:hypothetical protein